MEFANDRHRAAYDSVLAITSKYSDFGTMTEAPGFVLATELSRAFVLVLPWTEEATVLQARAYIDQDVVTDSELADYLLNLNANVVLGAWGWEAGKVFYQHTILADDINEDTFNATLKAVVGTVEIQGAEIVERWGAPDASGTCATPAPETESPNGNGDTPHEA